MADLIVAALEFPEAQTKSLGAKLLHRMLAGLDALAGEEEKVSSTIALLRF